jgi:hypothetical protein
MEAGERGPNWKTFHRFCDLFGWPQTFSGSSFQPCLLRNTINRAG